ncbi:hypothetical protein IGI04_020073, partial [Brassica rapa subsp. trilocularis]
MSFCGERAASLEVLDRFNGLILATRPLRVTPSDTGSHHVSPSYWRRGVDVTRWKGERFISLICIENSRVSSSRRIRVRRRSLSLFLDFCPSIRRMDPSDERRDTKRKQEYIDHLYNVADSAYGMPTRCPCGGRIIDEVQVKEEYDTRPGKRFFSCINYEADGLHYRQPWVIGVQEEMVRLHKRVEEADEMIKCVPILSKQIESLEAQVKRLTLLLDKLTGDIYNLTVQAAALEKVKGCPSVVTGVWEIKSDVD